MSPPCVEVLPIDYFAIYDGKLWWPIPFRMFVKLCVVNGSDFETVIQTIHQSGSVRFLGFEFRQCKKSFAACISQGSERILFTCYDSIDVEDGLDPAMCLLKEVI